MALALAYITSVLSLLFAVSLLDQYLSRRQPFHLLWGVALIILSAAMVLWFLRETFGINQWIFRLWYVTGAMLVPAYLGTGMLYLMASRRIANYFVVALLVSTVVALILALTAGFETPAECVEGLKGLECLDPSDTLTKMGFFPVWVSIPGAILNLYGGIAVTGAAVWAVVLLVREDKRRRGEGAAQSGEGEAQGGVMGRVFEVLKTSYRNTVLAGRLMWQSRDFRVKDPLVQRTASNIIITLGLIIGALGANLNTLGSSDAHLGLFLGSLLIIYGGFLASREVFQAHPHHQLTESVISLMETEVGPAATLEQLRKWLPFLFIRRSDGDSQ